MIIYIIISYGRVIYRIVHIKVLKIYNHYYCNNHNQYLGEYHDRIQIPNIWINNSIKEDSLLNVTPVEIGTII